MATRVRQKRNRRRLPPPISVFGAIVAFIRVHGKNNPKNTFLHCGKTELDLCILIYIKSVAFVINSVFLLLKKPT